MTTKKTAAKAEVEEVVVEKCKHCGGTGLIVLNIPSRSFYHTIEYSQREDICHNCKGSGLHG